jgi:fructose-bisphosphate aldolase class II
VNIATDTRLIWARVHRTFFNNHPEQFDPIVPGQAYIEAQEDFLIKKFELLGSIDKIRDFK